MKNRADAYNKVQSLIEKTIYKKNVFSITERLLKTKDSIALYEIEFAITLEADEFLENVIRVRETSFIRAVKRFEFELEMHLSKITITEK